MLKKNEKNIEIDVERDLSLNKAQEDMEEKIF